MTVCLDTGVFLQMFGRRQPLKEDSHFDAPKSAGYKPQPITPDEYIRLHLSARS
jgi:hypothetical protein